MQLLHAGGHGIGARKLSVAVAHPLLQARQENDSGPCTAATSIQTTNNHTQAARASMRVLHLHELYPSPERMGDARRPLHARMHTRTHGGGEKTSEITLSGGEQVVHPA